MTSSTEEQSGQEGKFWDRMAENYSKQPIADEAAYQKKLQITQQYLKKDMNVLEIGCGTGGTSIIHSPHVKHILATDYSAKMIEIAKGKAQDANIKNVEFQQVSIDRLKLPDESQDVVLGLSILHLLKNRDEAIAKTHRLLKPGGLFVTSTACIGDMGMATNFFMKTLFPIGKLFGMPHIGVFKTEDLKESLTQNGFKIEYEWHVKPGTAFIIGKKE